MYEGNNIINSVLKDGVNVVIAGPEELKYMEAANAKSIIFRGEVRVKVERFLFKLMLRGVIF